MITEEEYKKAKVIVEEYENQQLNIPLVIWRCGTDIFQNDVKIFTKDKEYKQVLPNPWVLIGDHDLYVDFS